MVTGGTIDRRALGLVVFADPDELAELEDITHPFIFGTIETLVEGIDDAVVVEIPLLVEPFGDDWKRIVVDARDEARRERSVARGLSDDEVVDRMARQPSRAEWLASADLVIPNHGGRSELRETVAQAQAAISGQPDS